MNDLLATFAQNLNIITILILATFVGMEIISKVPSVLHTPLMSGSNALSGVVIIGSMIVLGRTPADSYLMLSIGFIAVFLATLNVVGGFAVTDVMLRMFKKKKR